MNTPIASKTLKAVIVRVMSDMNKEQLIRAFDLV